MKIKKTHWCFSIGFIVFLFLFALLNYNKDQTKEVIIRSDGGICSQIAFHSLGLFFEEKGYNVKYDLSWFHESGKDHYGKFDRSFKLNVAFPHLKINEATPNEIKEFKKRYRKKWTLDKIPNKLYVDGYPERMTHFEKYKSVFQKHWLSVNSNVFDRILCTNSCAVHVRRGDLSEYNEVYGTPPSVDYFIKAIKIVQALSGEGNPVVFFFFSEEIQWIRDNIIPRLPKNTQYVCCDENDSSKGYLDLLFIAKAKFIISSHGSFGIFGKILSENNPLFISPKPVRYPNSIHIRE